ncbi:MAG: rod shape-determining protein [Dysgonamonadaceae bacterium]|jgi:cell division protein FtsA|nr:rod shape-determining protein [Dysgonamonadaceae bacterium]
MHEKFVAAVDLGTSRITAMLGKKDGAGRLTVIARESVDSDGCIRLGRIYNIDEVAKKVGGLINSINEKQERKIDRVYVGLGGQSMRSAEHTITRKLSTETLINQSLLDNIAEECLNYEPELLQLLSVSSPEYALDGHPEASPLGVQCSEITTKYQLITGRPFINLIKKSIEEKANIPVVDTIVSPEALAEVVLTPKEKEQGCALVDFGAGKTTVSIYKDKLLRYLVTIPLGSSLITKDLCSQNISEQEAEEFKIHSSLAMVENEDSIPEKTYTSQQIAFNKLNEIVEARADEILTNVAVQIERAGFAKGALAKGIVITGGGSGLKRLPEAIRRKTGYTVRVAGVREDVFANESQVELLPEDAQIVGLVACGTENCAKEKEIEFSETLFEKEVMVNPQVPKVEKPLKPGKSKFKRIIDKAAGKLFEGQE